MSSQLFKTVFRDVKNTDMNAIQHTTQSMIQSNLSLPFPMLLVLLDSLILVNSIHKLTYTVSRFPSQRLPCSAGRLTLKVLMATSSKSPSISLNIYQHLFEYVFRVSPSCIVIDNRESKSRGTLLHVIK